MRDSKTIPATRPARGAINLHGHAPPESAWPNLWQHQRWLALLLVLSVAASLWIGLTYSAQVPLDLYDFRQTQTALTAFWLARDGFHLAYETPVLGPPWSVPFEFPLYQEGMVLVSRGLRLPLDQAGRLLSYVATLLCVWPACRLLRDLRLPPLAQPLFVLLFLSSPLYLYWGRTVMIEMPALLFTLLGLSAFVRMRLASDAWRHAVSTAAWLTLAMLVKITTALPVALLAGLVQCAALWRAMQPRDDAQRWADAVRVVMQGVLALLLPLMVGVLWTHHAETLRNLNPISQSSRLSPAALNLWNWGTLEQRLTPPLYLNVLWGRLLLRNAGGPLCLILLALAWRYQRMAPHRDALLATAVLTLLPMLMFSNLHLVHDYYQASVGVFMLLGVGAVAAIALDAARPKLAATCVALMVLSNGVQFHRVYWNATTAHPVAATSRALAVGSFLQAHLPPDQVFVAFGHDWNSSLAYFAERRSFTVPKFAKDYPDIALHPERYVGGATLGAVVLCPPFDVPSRTDSERWASARGWRTESVGECYIALP